MEEIRKEIRQSKIDGHIIINHRGFRYLGPKDLESGWFLSISRGKLVRSLVEMVDAPEWINEVQEINVSDDFFDKNILPLLYGTRRYNFFRGNFY